MSSVQTNSAVTRLFDINIQFSYETLEDVGWLWHAICKQSHHYCKL